MTIGVVNWTRMSRAHPPSRGLYLCYDEVTHDWWIGIWTPPGTRDDEGELREPGWVRGSECSHWARLMTPQDSKNRSLAREERRA